MATICFGLTVCELCELTTYLSLETYLNKQWLSKWCAEFVSDNILIDTAGGYLMHNNHLTTH